MTGIAAVEPRRARRIAKSPTCFEQLTRLAEIGGIPARAARTIYEEVEAATLGGWSAAAARAGVPAKITAIWEKEMLHQTRPLREDARRLKATTKAPSATPKRSPKK